jgi:hypothetical protein
MDTGADTGESASDLERLIADLSESGLVVFVFGVGWWTAHLTGATVPVFRGPADRRWWHVELGDDWRALRERYGDRDESRVDRGTLLTSAA